MKAFEVQKKLIDAGFQFEKDSGGIWDRGGFRIIAEPRDNNIGTAYFFAFGQQIAQTRDVNELSNILENQLPNYGEQPHQSKKDQSPENIDPEKIAKDSCIDYELDFPEPLPLLKINGTMAGSPGNIVTFTGQKKSRKTFGLTMLVKDVLNDIASECSATPRQVIWIDTEQAQHHLVKIANRLSKLTGTEKPQMKRFFSLFGLREYTPPERVQGVEKAVENAPENSYLVVDGIRDLLNDFNDPTESNQLVTWLMRLSGEKQMLIICILHQNKGNTLARGHLGTELGNKSESLINVKVSDKNDAVSIIDAEATRNMPFDPLAFFIDENGLPQETEMPAAKPNSRDVTPSGIPDSVHENALKVIFHTIKEYSARQLHEAVANAISELGVKIGASKARSFVTYYEQKGFIKNTSQKIDRKRYVLNPDLIVPNENAPIEI